MAINDNDNDIYPDQLEAFEPDARSLRGGNGGGNGGFRRQQLRRKVCALCRDKVDIIDFKDTRFLQAFVPERAKIMPRRISGNCAIHQRMLAEAIKRSRTIAFLPFVTD
jgi:small subunit ribosomal protein S18